MEPLEWYRIVAPLVVCAGFGVVAVRGNPRFRFAVWRHAELFEVSLGRIAEVVPADRRRWLLVVACYHFAAYATATVGGVVLCLWVRAERARRGEADASPKRR